MPSQRDLIRRLSLHDQHYLDGMQSAAGRGTQAGRLDARGCSLGRVAALFALDGSESSYGWATSVALASGVTAEELVELLIALAPVLGSARVVSAAPKLGLALGYDV